jgi:hypothetical protein
MPRWPNASTDLRPDLVVLAGFMRILGDEFVRRYAGRLMNIHPSLLPSFPGLHTHRRALDEGVRIHGCTVHFVTPALDHGPVIIQAAVPVLDSDDEATLAARVLRQEHRIYPQAVRWFAEDRLRVENGRVRLAAEAGRRRRAGRARGVLSGDAGRAAGRAASVRWPSMPRRWSGWMSNCSAAVPSRSPPLRAELRPLPAATAGPAAVPRPGRRRPVAKAARPPRLASARPSPPARRCRSSPKRNPNRANRP